MPFLPHPVSRSKKVRRGPLFYAAVLALPIAAAGIGAGYGISLSVKARRAWLEASAREIATMRLRYQDLLGRHPDLDLGSAPAEIDAFLALPLPRQARQLERGTAALVSLRDQCAALVGAPPPPAGAVRYKTFSPNGFKSFFDSLAQEEVLPPALGAPMTELAAADAHITQMAVKRGYRPRPRAPEGLLVRESHYQTHSAALDAFHAMREAGREHGIELAIISAYRSLEVQQWNWMNRLHELALEIRKQPVSAEEIARGEADDVVEAVLRKNAIPGYSKHHTGYAMDFEDRASGRVFTDFEFTPAHAWMSEGNFLNPKRFGFIPSYPSGATEQGPDPEPWEYVWVGEELLREGW